VVPLSGDQGPISHGLSAAERREDQTAIATVENVRVQTKVLSALALEMDKAVSDKKKKKEPAIMVADTLQLGEAITSAAFASRKKLELGSETVRKMEKTETVGFITEEEKERVEKINKEKEELTKLKRRDFFNGGRTSSSSLPRRWSGSSGKKLGKRSFSSKQYQRYNTFRHNGYNNRFNRPSPPLPMGDANTQPVLPTSTTGEVRQPGGWKKQGKGTRAPR
jgi:hypothetical protein